jgi:hypothetical protein
MSITGHSTREMFDRYNTADTEDARQAIEQLGIYLQTGVDQNVDQAPPKKKREASSNLPTSQESNEF